MAFFSESIEETQKRLGIVEASGLHLSVGLLIWRVRDRVISILIEYYINSLFHLNEWKRG